MSAMRRQVQEHHQRRRMGEQLARCGVVNACRAVQARGVPVAHVTRCLWLSERTVRRWRQDRLRSPPARRGRRPHWASREERNQIYQFLRQRGTSTSLAAVRAAFPQVRRTDVGDLVRRFRRVQRRKTERHRSRLQWRRPGTVWAADFTEQREPIEGRYGWILSVKDLASRYQLAWSPVSEATAAVVEAMYARLFAEHGAPLVMKSDNGGPFRAEGTKRLLDGYGVTPLYSPKRRPQYNGGIERANGLLAGYQEAVAEFYSRRAGPTCEDAETARRWANDLSRPRGWRGPTAGQLWAEREPVSAAERSAFQAAVQERRAEVRAEWKFAANEPLAHDAAAAIDRRAVRDALVQHGLLAIHPRHRKRGFRDQNPASPLATQAPGAGILQLATHAAPPTVGGAPDPRPDVPVWVHPLYEEANSSTNNSSASGQN
jgi:putative transposase